MPRENIKSVFGEPGKSAWQNLASRTFSLPIPSSMRLDQHAYTELYGSIDITLQAPRAAAAALQSNVNSATQTHDQRDRLRHINLFRYRLVD